jgi:hypothetical protein
LPAGETTTDLFFARLVFACFFGTVETSEVIGASFLPEFFGKLKFPSKILELPSRKTSGLT